jgi:hypothetical protein
VRAICAIWFVLCALVGGCIDRLPARAIAAGPDGTITTSVRRAVRWPLRVTAIRLELDGVPVPAEVPLPTVDGAHTIEIVAESSIPPSTSGVFALVAAWPELSDGRLDNDTSRAALEVIELARALGSALRRYRRALTTDTRREPDLPF